jgi:hypothetical protein
MSRFSQIPADRAVGYVLRGVIAFVLFVLVTFGAFNLLENVDANEIVVVQARGSGKLSFHTSPGLICQCFGKLTSYDRRRNYVTDQAVQFSEGGHGVMEKVSVQWEMPLDPANLTELHTQFGASDVIEQSLVAPIVRKVVYLTGSLMTSRESYAERRSYLISFVEDQIAHGVYKTVTREVRQEDPLTKAEKLVKVVDIVQKDGQPDRQEVSSLQRFGIRTSNFAFDKLAYDEKVQAQSGAANAAAAQWEQEVLKAKAVTQAEQGLAVQKLAVQTADLYKQEQTLKGEADAAYRRKVLEADGALAAKLATYEKVNETWATAFQNYAGQLVPNVVMGQQGGTGLSSAQSFMDLLTAKTALDLGLSAKPAVK